MKIFESVLIALTAVAIQGCATAPRVLSVKSDPADAEVCIKGKNRSQFFNQTKNCIGTTPLEVDSVTITDDSGNKKLVKFSDLEKNKEQFYLVVSRAGYAPQSVVVPSWEHFLSLRQESPKESMAQAIAPMPMAAVMTSPLESKGMAKINSNPVGALVYVNDFLKGNTPYVIEGEKGQTVRLKIEQAGYRSIEQSITIETGKTMEINLSLEKEPERVAIDREEKIVQASK